jgi:hypothetical protein
VSAGLPLPFPDNDEAFDNNSQGADFVAQAAAGYAQDSGGLELLPTREFENLGNKLPFHLRQDFGVNRP